MDDHNTDAPSLSSANATSVSSSSGSESSTVTLAASHLGMLSKSTKSYMLYLQSQLGTELMESQSTPSEHTTGWAMDFSDNGAPVVHHPGNHDLHVPDSAPTWKAALEKYFSNAEAKQFIAITEKNSQLEPLLPASSPYAASNLDDHISKDLQAKIKSIPITDFADHEWIHTSKPTFKPLHHHTHWSNGPVDGFKMGPALPKPAWMVEHWREDGDVCVAITCSQSCADECEDTLLDQGFETSMHSTTESPGHETSHVCGVCEKTIILSVPEPLAP